MFSWFSNGAKAKELPPAPEPEPLPAPPPPAAKPMDTFDGPRERPPIYSERSMKQLGLFFAGAGFLALSIAVSRRAVARRMTTPGFYHPSHRTPPTNPENKEGSLIAIEALNLATLNVMSFSVMATGGLAWAFDISSIDDLRTRARKHIHGPRGVTDEAAEQEIEEWIASVLSRKEQKDKDGKDAQQSKDD